VTAETILDRLARLHPKRIDLSLDRIARLLAACGHPERRLAPVVHVAGTNGKGSVIAYLGAMLRAGGYRVQSYISPHLRHFNERIRLAAGEITDDDLSAVLGECERVNLGEPITFFEVTTAAAFLAFAREPADALLLEVGLGGRLDATNMVAAPVLTAITPVSIDHEQFLGTSLSAVAFEKAGILKRRVPAVIGRQSSAGSRVIMRQAAAVGAPLVRRGQRARRHGGTGWWRVRTSAEGLEVRTAQRTLSLAAAVPVAPHQVDNAAQAVACLMHLPHYAVSRADMARGLAQASWPGRMQRLSGCLAAALPHGAELWLDGGHNPAAGTALAATLDELRRADETPRPVNLVVGMLDSKDAEGFLRPLAQRVVRAFALAIPGAAASLGAAALAGHARRAGLDSQPVSGIIDALRIIARTAPPGVAPRVLICGSLYLAGCALSEDEPG